MTTLHCEACGKANRIPAKHLTSQGKCGACAESIGPTGRPISVGAEEFDEVIGSVAKPVLVDFWAEWCGPCRAAAPELEKVAQAMAGEALVLKVNTEQHPSLAARYGVRGIPNFLVLKAGKVVRQQAGLVDHRTMEGWLRQA